MVFFTKNTLNSSTFENRNKSFLIKLTIGRIHLEKFESQKNDPPAFMLGMIVQPIIK